MKILKANGANIPALGFGTWQLRDEACVDMVTNALQVGYRHIDTAIMYLNEIEVGKGIRASSVAREEIFLTTKVWPDDVREGSFQKAVEGSLKRLDLDYVDLLLIHWPPQTGDVSTWAKLLNDVAGQGMVKNIGVSNFTIPLLEEMVELSERPIACNQVENHPYINQSRLMQTCKKNGVALIAYCPLFRGGAIFENGEIVKAAKAHGKSPAQIILRWHLQQENAGAIPKTATPSRVQENFNIFDFELSTDEMAAISGMTVRHERICDYDFSPVWDAA